MVFHKNAGTGIYYNYKMKNIICLILIFFSIASHAQTRFLGTVKIEFEKTVYARHLAEAFIAKKIQLNKLTASHDDVVRGILKQVKGIGDWTTDVYLIHALRRTNIFPIGDLALVNALKEIKSLLITYLADKVVREADKASEKRNYTAETFERWKQLYYRLHSLCYKTSTRRISFISKN